MFLCMELIDLNLPSDASERRAYGPSQCTKNGFISCICSALYDPYGHCVDRKSERTKIVFAQSDTRPDSSCAKTVTHMLQLPGSIQKGRSFMERFFVCPIINAWMIADQNIRNS